MHLYMSTSRKIVFSFVALAASAVWVACLRFGYSVGNPPTNSKGKVCGFGNQSGRPLLLYLNLAQCSDLQPHVDVCNTKKICVKDCPVTYWHSAQGKARGLEEFCEVMNLQRFNTTTMARLEELRLCPSYVVPSESYLGRCLPSPDLLLERKLKDMKTGGGRILLSDNLLQGSKFVKDSIHNRGPVEEMLGSYNIYWIPVIGVLCIFFFFLSFLKPKAFLILHLIVSTGLSLIYSPLVITCPQNYFVWLLLIMVASIIFKCVLLCCICKSVENNGIYSVQRIFIHLLIITVVVVVTLLNGMWLINRRDKLG